MSINGLLAGAFVLKDELKENSKDHKAIKASLEKVTKRVEFINYDENKKEATYVRLPERNELNADINEALIVEFYNK